MYPLYAAYADLHYIDQSTIATGSPAKGNPTSWATPGSWLTTNFPGWTSDVSKRISVDTGTTSAKFTVQYPGVYVAQARMALSGVLTTHGFALDLAWALNGTPVSRSIQHQRSDNAADAGGLQNELHTTFLMIELEADDQLQLQHRLYNSTAISTVSLQSQMCYQQVYMVHNGPMEKQSKYLRSMLQQMVQVGNRGVQRVGRLIWREKGRRK